MVFDIATLDGLAADIGAPVPNGDPEALFALADHIEAKADAWDGHADELARLKAQLRSVLVGETGDAHDQHLAELLNGPNSLQGDSAAVRAGVAALRNYAADLQDNQWTSRLLAAWLLATMIWGAASIIATGGESLVEVAVARVRTAAAINALKEVLWQRITAILTELLVNAGRGVLLGGAEQLVVQGLQVAAGERTSLNGQLIAGTGLSFAEFGVGAEAVEHGVLGLVADAAKDSPAASVAAWATSKMLSGMGGNTVATAAAGGPITAETLWTGAAMGGAGALADARAKGASVASVPEPTETAGPANAIDSRPTLRFEKQPDGTFAWPGETTNEAGPQAHTASASAPTTAAGELVAGAWAGHSWSGTADPGAPSLEEATAGHAPPLGDVAGRGLATTHTPPAAGDTEHLPGNSVTAGLDPAPVAHASVGARPSEGTRDPPITARATYTESLTARPALSPAPLQSIAGSPATPTVPNAAPAAPTTPSAAGPPSLAPTMPTADAPAPTSTPAAPSSSGRNTGLSSPTPDPPAGPADAFAAGKSRSQPADAPAADRVDTTAKRAADPGTHDTGAEQAAHAASVDPAAQPHRPEADRHLAGREDSAAANRQRGSAVSVTQRRDPVNRHDPSLGPRSRPGKLPGGGAVKDPLPDAVTRVPDLLAAEDIGLIKARHDRSGPDAGGPQSHHRGGGHGGETGGGAGDGVAGHGEGGGEPPGPDRPVGGASDDPEIPRQQADCHAQDLTPPILEGWEELQSLQNRYRDAVVFHGSNLAIRELEPRQTFWTSLDGTRLPDGDPAVCAAAEPDIPAYMALFKGRARIHYRERLDGRIRYMVEASRDQLGNVVGYVHVLPSEDFEEVSLPTPQGFSGPEVEVRNPELRAFHSVRPLAIVRITLEDFPHDIDFDYSVDG